VVALLASYGKDTAKEISASHISVPECFSEAGILVVSIGSDGAATKILTLCFLQTSVNQHLFCQPQYLSCTKYLQHLYLSIMLFTFTCCYLIITLS
jgi:hypothetical protein